MDNTGDKIAGMSLTVGLITAVIASAVCIAGTNIFAEQGDITDANAALKQKIKEKMNDRYAKDGLTEEWRVESASNEYGIPYGLIFEEDGTVVVGIDAQKAIEFGKTYTADDVKNDPDTKHDYVVLYDEKRICPALYEGA